MTESKKRKFHPPEFKAKVGLEALGGMKTVNQIAQEYAPQVQAILQFNFDLKSKPTDQKAAPTKRNCLMWSVCTNFTGRP
jgi:hypothetical protein